MEKVESRNKTRTKRSWHNKVQAMRIIFTVHDDVDMNAAAVEVQPILFSSSSFIIQNSACLIAF